MSDVECDDAILGGTSLNQRKSPSNLPASVRQRLLNIAKQQNEVFDLVLTRYALERLYVSPESIITQKSFCFEGGNALCPMDG